MYISPFIWSIAVHSGTYLLYLFYRNDYAAGAIVIVFVLAGQLFVIVCWQEQHRPFLQGCP